MRQAVQRFLADESVYRHLQNPQPAWRHGRPVFQVRQESQGKIRGVLHDRSHSGATLFIEPSVVVESANRLSDVRAAEHREIEVILAHICRGLRRCQAEIQGAVAALVHLDLTYAKARFSTDYEMSAPHLGDSLRLSSARHPLLLQWASVEYDRPVRELDQRVIPISPRLGDDFDLLLVTGPNTGGKTVLLKTIGICQLMAQSGMHIPARPGSQVTVYEHLFADIGDEQSIQQSLSTFSAHMQHVIQILKQTNAQTMVLLDELGAGTDPTEGASLATAILDELLRSQGHIIATTHLGQLKTYAFARARAENASVQFDSQSLRPTYKLFIGTPGSSNALAIARRLGMPERVIRSAHDLLAEHSDGSSELINQVQTTRELAERKRQQSENMLNDAQGVHQEATRRLAELREERKRLRGQADRQVDDTMRRVRATIQGFDRQMANAPKPWHAFVQDLVEDINQLASSTPLAERHRRFTEGLKKGDSVYVLPLRRSAIVDRIRRKRQSVQLFVDGKQIEVSFEQICRNT